MIFWSIREAFCLESVNCLLRREVCGYSNSKVRKASQVSCKESMSCDGSSADESSTWCVEDEQAVGREHLFALGQEVQGDPWSGPAGLQPC